mmetsp:Transcript_12056/g.25679  ORF Transcript_12056/g.25679 Transcript_12056/m.25679 type:complete len:754 (+) Transcript_12056:308-2569(+)|eukprot:CAMPEP_0183730692 /NCGR_PEP_ID=MMETSP0737-20130205/33481_1 /TAXON_ID=385413 /ORGANISM="Thalassiosira miniscula, Strain CCMP1093" /LENGTH=753 /DNA_ID=CAMNT_0025963255 /DNA_START=199 /DNA_END=2460 /DNA_ORIENTATION=+
MEASLSKKRQRQEDSDAPRSKKQNAANLLQDVPTTQHYQVSYMHRQTVTHVCTSLRHGYVITGSTDGVVKFWKRTATSAAAAAPGGSNGGASALGGGMGGADKAGGSSRCLEFVKSYSSHVGPLLALCTSQPNGDSAVSIGYDGVIKFYDVATFDVSGMIRTNNTSNKKKFRLGRHAALIEREDLYLVVSTRAPTREEWQMEMKEKELAEQRRRQQEDDSDDDGPLPESSGEKTKKDEDVSKATGMVPPGSILLFSGTNLSSDPIRIINYHATPVTALAYHSTKEWVVSGDSGGVLEVWNVPFSSEDGQGPLPFQSKLNTDLYTLMKKKTYSIDIAISEPSKERGGYGHFAVYSSDRKIRLFSFQNCKLVCIYDERMKVYDKLLSSKSSAMGIDAIEYGKRAALEREMEDAHLLSGGVSTNPTTKQSLSAVTTASEGSYHQQLHLTFDNTGKYLLLPTIVGVKIINIQTHRVTATVGKGDASALRFLHLCLCPGDAKINQQMQLARMGGSSAAIKHGNGNDEPNDSLLVALAYGKRRFYAFSHHDPLDKHDNAGNEPDGQTILARDILNEAPDASDLLEASHMGRGDNDADATAQLTTASKAILRTTHGDISIKLFPKDTPRTIQNFIGHAQSGYYDNVIFHRIIPGFMIQTGDPLGDGTGGESIWGGEFEDEIRRELRHDRPFTVSMANAGPNTNGSQFFITTVPTPWLDNKHTVFGRVMGGMEVVMAIEGVKTDELDRPLSEVKILSIDVS